MADGSARIVLDLQCTLSEIAAMGLVPGAPFALARMSSETTKAQAQAETVEEEKEKPGQFCVMAANFCRDPVFWDWAGVGTEDEARSFILDICGVKSRKELDGHDLVERTFFREIRHPFLQYKKGT
jgi:hypothetical protein